MNQCECCGADNAWGLMNPDFKYVCLPCAEGKHAKVVFYDGVYRQYLTCKCGHTKFIPGVLGVMQCSECNDIVDHD